MKTTQRNWLNVTRARSRRVGAVLLALLAFQACTKWVAQTEPVTRLVDTKREKALRVTLGSGAVVEIRDVQIVGDSLVGSHGTCPIAGCLLVIGAHARVAVAIADVRSTEVLRVAEDRVVLLIFGLVVDLVVVIVALSKFKF